MCGGALQQVAAAAGMGNWLDSWGEYSRAFSWPPIWFFWETMEVAMQLKQLHCMRLLHWRLLPMP
jgi:hypothetical protein